jgi:hypothetical protein
MAFEAEFSEFGIGVQGQKRSSSTSPLSKQWIVELNSTNWRVSRELGGGQLTSRHKEASGSVFIVPRDLTISSVNHSPQVPDDILSFTVLFLSPAGSHFCFDRHLPFYLTPEALY